MADAITIKALQDASLDAKSLEEVVNGNESKQVTTRKGETYPSVKKAIKTLFENGGLPATPFATKALMESSELVDGQLAMVYNETANNGLYIKTAGAWVKSSYDPLTKSIADLNPLYKAKAITAADDLNSFVVDGIYNKASASDIADGKNYPVKVAGTLLVNALSSTYGVQRYITQVAGEVYIRSFTKSIFTEWKKIAFESAHSIGTLILEWHESQASAANYDKVTQIFTFTGMILAAIPTSRLRCRITDFTLDFTGTSRWSVAYLDLNNLPADNNIDSTNAATYINIKGYDTGYIPTPNVIPLFKYNNHNNTITACSGFIPIKNGEPNGGSTVSVGTGLQFTKTADAMGVYFDMPSGNKLKVNLVRQVYDNDPIASTQSQSDLWRIERAFRAGNDMSEGVRVIQSGEWSLAMTHQESTQAEGVTKDHVGGVHGDELTTSVKFFVDGVEKQQDFTQASAKSAKEVQLVQSSVIYFQGTTRPLADHIKIVTFSNGVVNIKQHIDFKYEAVPMQKIWVAMLPTMRDDGSTNITNKSARSVDYYTQVDDNSDTTFEMRYTPVVDGSVIRQWSSVSGISVEVRVNKSPNFSELQNTYVANSPQYNKVYVSAIDGSSTSAVNLPINTVLETDVDYIIKC